MGKIENMTVNSDSAVVKRKCQVWRKRTLLERYLIIVCFLISSVFIAMVGLLVHLIYSYNQPSVPVCSTSLCKREAGRILSYMDLSADPCEDFYIFSCGSFIKNQQPSPIGGRIDLDYIIAERMKELSKDLLEAAEKNNGPEFVKKVKKFYKSCLNGNTDTSGIIEQILLKTELKFWPIAEEDTPDMEKVLAITALFAKRNPFYFIVSFARINDGTLTIVGKGSVLVEEEVLLNTTDENYIKKKKEYKSLLSYALYKAKAPFEIIDEEVDKLIEFETLLAKVKQNHSDTEHNEANSTTRVNEVIPECGKISFPNVLKYAYEYLGRADYVSGETPVKVYNLEYLESLCEIFKTTDHRIIYNYVVWFLLANKLKEFDPYFKKTFRDIADEDYFPAARWEECVNKMTESIFVAGVSYLVLNHIQPDDSLEEVKDYILEMRKAMERMFSEESWIDPISKDASISLMWNISAEVGYSSGYLDEDLLENHYSLVNVTDDYLENSLQVAFWQNSLMLLNDSSLLINNITISSPIKSAGYFTGKKFVLTLGLLVPPYFVHKGPKFFNYAVTGFVVAHELTHAYDSLDTDNSEGNETFKWTNETIQRFIEKKQCYVDQYSKFPLGKDGLMLNGSNTFGDNIADNSGVLQALAAYEKYLKENGEEPQLPGLDYTNQQMFFISYAQQWCEVVNSEVEQYKRDVHSPARYRVIGPLQNAAQFAEAFKCPVNSPMNPAVKCRMYG